MKSTAGSRVGALKCVGSVARESLLTFQNGIGIS